MSAQEALGYLYGYAALKPGSECDDLLKAIRELEAALRFDAQFEEMRAAGYEPELYAAPEDGRGWKYLAYCTAKTADPQGAPGQTASEAIAGLYVIFKQQKPEPPDA